MNEFGELLKQFRIEAEMTQFKLAEVSATSESTVRRLEKGKITDPRMATVKLLADALRLSPEERRRLLSLAVDAELPHDPEMDACERLGDTVRELCRAEEENHGLRDPRPLTVRWRARADLTDHWDNVHDVPLGGPASNPVDLTGDLAAIADVYRRIPSGRLVVLGRAGSGKTMLTLRFTLEILETRGRADPVPVIFSLASWDPTTTGLRDWLTERLLRDHPYLGERTPSGVSTAAALVAANRILPVLDGFDEIAKGLHRPALEALSRTSMPWLLTSRQREYETSSKVLGRSAAVELADLTPADLTGYLSRRAEWAPVLAHVAHEPDSQIAAVLSTPLMVALARRVYDRANPSELLDTTRFPTARSIEDHLLGGFVDTVYRDAREWDPEESRRWLGHLARHLGRLGTTDLAWWELCNTTRRSTRILAVVVTVALSGMLIDWLIYIPIYMLMFGAREGFYTGLLEGVFLAPAVGIAFGLVHGVMTRFRGLVITPSRVRLQLRGRPHIERPFITVFWTGLFGGFVVGLGYGSMGTLQRGLVGDIPPHVSAAALLELALINLVVMGLIFGLAAGLVFGLSAKLESPLDLSIATDPLSLLTANRVTVTRQAAVVAPMLAISITLCGSLVVALLQAPLGPLVWNLPGGFTVGVVGGLIGAVGYACAFTAWGQWVMLSRVWLPVTGAVPWDLPGFLDDAYRRRVLRQAGAVYQFRHARLQEYLADHC